MLVQRHWRRVKLVPYHKREFGEVWKTVRMYTGYFLFGVLPIYISCETTWYIK